ncbi:MAG: NADH-quinone oxidoreductase subunit J [Candidatus Micrarchaeaceae archaeon]
MNYIFFILFALSSIFSIAAFFQKKVLYSAIMMAFVFTMTAFLFLYLNNTAIALLQILILVGGLATYFIVAVASEEEKKSIRPVSIILGIIIFAVLYIPFYSMNEGTPYSHSFSQEASGALSFPLALYLSSFLLFMASVSTVLIIAKYRKQIA